MVFLKNIENLETIFSCLFIAAFLVTIAFYIQRRNKHHSRNSGTSLGSPQISKIVEEGKGYPYLLSSFAILWSVLIVAFWSSIRGSFNEGPGAAALGIAIIALQVVLVFLAFMGFRYRRSVLKLNLPVTLGEKLQGAIIVPGRISDQKVLLSLRCVQWITFPKYRGHPRTVAEKEMWRDEAISNIPNNSSGCLDIPVFFAIPPDAKPTETDSKTRTVWILQAAIKRRFGRLTLVFHVPVSSSVNQRNGGQKKQSSNVETKWLSRRRQTSGLLSRAMRS